MHRLLKRQINKHLKDVSDNTKQEMSAFLTSIDEAYQSFDEDLKHMERILDQSSNELFKKNSE